jgi:4a-hydroxytetrahydrobiopterin dehydratase
MNIAEREVGKESDQELLHIDKIPVLAREIPEWEVEEQRITREFLFDTFRQAIDFVAQVADVAEEEQHHPDIAISYNKVDLTLTTHKVGGLTAKDFALAKKIDYLVRESEKS